MEYVVRMDKDRRANQLISYISETERGRTNESLYEDHKVDEHGCNRSCIARFADQPGEDKVRIKHTQYYTSHALDARLLFEIMK